MSELSDYSDTYLLICRGSWILSKAKSYFKLLLFRSVIFFCVRILPLHAFVLVDSGEIEIEGEGV